MEVEAAAYWLGWVRLAQLVAVFLVAVGVVAEFAGEWISRPLERVIDDAREFKFTQLKKEADEANIARLRLEKEMAPRTISPEQEAQIVAKLRPLFKGQRVGLFVDSRSATPDTYLLGARMSVILANSGLNMKFFEVVSGRYSRPGIHVSQKIGLVYRQFLPLRTALVDALKAEGVAAESGAPIAEEIDPPGMLSGALWDQNDIAGVRVVVGSKPNDTSNDNVIIIQQAR
jgi:hypothetical protein